MVSQVYYGHLRSKQGVNIDFGYTLQCFADETGRRNCVVQNIQFVLTGQGVLHADSKITVVLINRFFVNNSYYDGDRLYKVQLTAGPTEDGLTTFSGNLDGPIETYSIPADIHLAYRPQIAVVIDGEWQTDPVQPGEQHNFNIAWHAST